jgi:phenylacetate-CoA ligase
MQPGGAAAARSPRETLLALQAQLELSERLPREQLRAMQVRRLEQVLRHASHALPFWRERLAAAGYDPALPLTEALFARLPLLTRAEVQHAGTALHVPQLPPGHGKVSRIETSGSTGRPATFLCSEIEQVFWHAFTLREHLWHRREAGTKLGAIRYMEQGGTTSGWGVSTDSVVATGPGAALRIDTPLSEQLDWLQRERPQYLLSYASNIAALAHACIRERRSLPGLREVRSVSETVRPELRQLVRAAWGVGLVDIYSAKEVGYIALQCPEHEHYHVQEENLLLEILDAQGRPCAPGTAGRVVLTALHKFAMPLVRYEIGDYAVAGEACSCGRGLMVLREVLGRTRNMLRLPDGGQRWPLCDLVGQPGIAGILQYQYIQKTLHDIEVRLVVGEGWSRDLEQPLAAIIHRRLGYPFNLEFTYPAAIERSPAGKFEDFLCLVMA